MGNERDLLLEAAIAALKPFSELYTFDAISGKVVTLVQVEAILKARAIIEKAEPKKQENPF